jgi:hypothetical protein
LAQSEIHSSVGMLSEQSQFTEKVVSNAYDNDNDNDDDDNNNNRIISSVPSDYVAARN